jgi:GNAT superfamily N-acetyltransferase
VDRARAPAEELRSAAGDKHDAVVAGAASTHDELTIRRAVPADVEALVEIQATASLAGFAHIFPPERYPFPTESVRERWTSELAGDTVAVLIAESGSAPAGLVAVKPGWLEALYVVPALWGRGVAKSLHDEASARLRELGTRVARLWVLEHNARARSFYERLGWSPNGEIRPVPFPPYPIDVGYTLELGETLRGSPTARI